MLGGGGGRGGGPGVPVTTPNIPWRKRHDDIVWYSVTPPLKNPSYAPVTKALADGQTLYNKAAGLNEL